MTDVVQSLSLFAAVEPGVYGARIANTDQVADFEYESTMYALHA